MRRLILVLALLALPAVSANDPSTILVDDTPGTFLLPTTPFVGSPVAHAFDFVVPACYRMLAIDLRYDPAELVVDAQAGEVAVAYEFRVEIWRNGTRVLDERVTRSGYGSLVGIVPTIGEHTMRLSLGWGADVDYTMRLRGLHTPNDPGCATPA